MIGGRVGCDSHAEEVGEGWKGRRGIRRLGRAVAMTQFLPPSQTTHSNQLSAPYTEYNIITYINLLRTILKHLLFNYVLEEILFLALRRSRLYLRLLPWANKKVGTLKILPNKTQLFAVRPQ